MQAERGAQTKKALKNLNPNSLAKPKAQAVANRQALPMHRADSLEAPLERHVLVRKT